MTIGIISFKALPKPYLEGARLDDHVHIACDWCHSGLIGKLQRATFMKVARCSIKIIGIFSYQSDSIELAPDTSDFTEGLPLYNSRLAPVAFASRSSLTVTLP